MSKSIKLFIITLLALGICYIWLGEDVFLFGLPFIFLGIVIGAMLGISFSQEWMQ